MPDTEEVAGDADGVRGRPSTVPWLASGNPCGSEVDGQVFYSVQQGAAVKGWFAGEGQLGEAFEQCLQADVQFHAGERGAEADVDTGAEADVVAGVGTGDVEFVGTFEDTRITIGAAEEKEDGRAFLHGVAVDLKCFGGDPGPDLDDGVVAQPLLYRVGPDLGMCLEAGELIRVTDKCHDGVAERMGGGDEPGTEE